MTRKVAVMGTMDMALLERLQEATKGYNINLYAIDEAGTSGTSGNITIDLQRLISTTTTSTIVRNAFKDTLEVFDLYERKEKVTKPKKPYYRCKERW